MRTNGAPSVLSVGRAEEAEQDHAPHRGEHGVDQSDEAGTCSLPGEQRLRCERNPLEGLALDGSQSLPQRRVGTPRYGEVRDRCDQGTVQRLPEVIDEV